MDEERDFIDVVVTIRLRVDRHAWHGEYREGDGIAEVRKSVKEYIGGGIQGSFHVGDGTWKDVNWK